MAILASYMVNKEQHEGLAIEQAAVDNFVKKLEESKKPTAGVKLTDRLAW